MPRASRHGLRNDVWHMTHRCHKKECLRKFARHRQSWRRWLCEAKNRCGLRSLDYGVTSNHSQVLVRDGVEGEVARGMKLAADRAAPEIPPTHKT